MNQIIRADFVIKSPVTCCDCGLTVLSPTFRVTFEDIAFDDIESALNAQNAGSHFPVGWAAYGYPTYRCPDCKI